MLSSWLPHKVGARRRIRAVDVHVAVLAALLDEPRVRRREARGRAGRHDPRAVLGGEVVAGPEVPGAGEVAVVAEVGQLLREQALVVRAVRLVAGRAVLPHGGMLEEE